MARFPSARHLAAYAGLVPSDPEAADHPRRGSVGGRARPALARRKIAVVGAARHILRIAVEEQLSVAHIGRAVRETQVGPNLSQFLMLSLPTCSHHGRGHGNECDG
ncbi:MAG: transposase [Myxococcales bacterium]|nr:transposase [Myxococcales bacterium]